jgi:hypothetical protein
MSVHSSSRLMEGAVASTSPEIVGAVRAYLHHLPDEHRKIDARFIARIKELPVSPRRAPFGTPTRRTKPRLTAAHKTWLVVLRPADDDPNYEQQISDAATRAATMLTTDNSELDYFFFTGNGSIRKRARPGDSVILIHRGTKREMAGASVRLASTILTVRNVGRRTYFFVVRLLLPDPTYNHLRYWSQCYRRVRALQRLKNAVTPLPNTFCIACGDAHSTAAARERGH